MVHADVTRQGKIRKHKGVYQNLGKDKGEETWSRGQWARCERQGAYGYEFDVIVRILVDYLDLAKLVELALAF